LPADIYPRRYRVKFINTTDTNRVHFYGDARRLDEDDAHKERPLSFDKSE
jgi:hypothetical protein